MSWIEYFMGLFGGWLSPQDSNEEPKEAPLEEPQAPPLEKPSVSEEPDISENEQSESELELEMEPQNIKAVEEIPEPEPAQTSALRPKVFDGFIGHKEIVARLKRAIGSAKKRKQCLGHILLFGQPGLGKTTLSNIVANEMDCNFKTITGGTITSQKDIFRILYEIGCKQNEGIDTVLFIDEIHRLHSKETPEELWYPIFEEFKFYNALQGTEIPGIGVVLSNMVWIKPFTIIGATTRSGDLTKALRDRFQIACSLHSYISLEISQIIRGFAQRSGIKITEVAATRLAKSARGNPRVSINLILACRDRVVVQDKEIIDLGIVLDELKSDGIDELGLTWQDYEILKILAENEKGMGIKNLAGTADIEVSTLETVIEPYIKQLRLLKTTHRRFITEHGIELLKKKKLF